jgi:hypothetical protein
MLLYLRATSVIGAVAVATHGHVERTRRGVTSVPVNVVGVARDGLLGCMLGPFLVPFYASGTQIKCPMTSGSPSDLF